MVVLPAGSFAMGSPPSERGRYDIEGPQHRVSMPSFAIGKYAVTFAQWDACVAEGGCNLYRPDDEGWGRGNRPVISVSWQDAQAYVWWLNGKLRGTASPPAGSGNGPYRLPSEAEWEYAARAGTTTARYWGNDPRKQCRYANGADLTRLPHYVPNDHFPGWMPAQCRDGYAHTAPVGSFPSNPWGLYDMLGNVSQWTADCWHAGYAGAPTDGSAWTSGNCGKRVFRGGSYADDPTDIRTAERDWGTAVNRSDGLGFRVAKTLP